MWLASLGSLVAPDNYPGGPSASLTERDYLCETLVVREVLFRCLHLAANLSGEASAAGRGGAEAPADAVRTGRDSAAPEWESGDELSCLVDGLERACAVCDAALSSDFISLATWRGMGISFLQVLDGSAAARALVSTAGDRAGGRTRARLSELTEAVSPEELGDDLDRVFGRLMRLLGLLAFVEEALSADAPLKPLLAVFAFVHQEAKGLLDFVEQLSGAESAGGGLRQALDGTAYAARMELRKTFDQELRGFCRVASPSQTFSRAESASGLLRNCFQQSVVTLAQSLDPSVRGRELFETFQNRLDESLLLRGELWRLIHFVKEAERLPSHALPGVVAGRLYEFSDGSLRHLMYKDREPFEKFMEEVESARGEAELGDVLHRLHAFLETLFGQVNMRAALAQHPFNPDGVDLETPARRT